MENTINTQIISQIIEAYQNGLHRITISGPHKSNNIYKKITGLPIESKNKKSMQFSYYTQEKVFHFNCESLWQIEEKLRQLLELGYKQWDISCINQSVKFIVNKKGNFKKITEKTTSTNYNKASNTHNRVKNHILKDSEPIDMLIKLGIMNKDGKILAPMQKKFRQINKFLETVASVEEYIGENAQILDFGCGKSYLSFALYYYLNILKEKDVTITGLDLKEDVVNYCRNMAEKCAFEKLKFHCGDIKDASHLLNSERLDSDSFNNEIANKYSMLITLHACDTATDYALYYAIKNNIELILTVPCCQHELFYQVENDCLKPLTKHGVLKERFASLLTDASRGQLLEVMGYNVSIIEFIDMENTPKNIMIKAIKTGNGINKQKLQQFEAMAGEYNISPKLYSLISEFLEGNQV